MEQIIRNMIKQAEEYEDYELINYVKRLIDILAETINAPSNWRNIGSDFTKEYDESSWVYEKLELWNHED